MVSDNVPQIFLCHKCGAQNVVGQQFCQACGEKFQYNCPYCGVVVDPTMVTCPNCRKGLEWPTPQRVKAFPKTQTEAYRGYQEQPELEEEEAGKKPKQKKSGPWLIGCLGAIVLVICILIAVYFIDASSQQAPPVIPPAVSGNQTKLEPMQAPEFEPLHIAGTIVVPEAGAPIWSGETPAAFLQR